MVAAVLIVVGGVAYTATHLNLSRFDNELRFRGQAHDDLTRRPEGSEGEGRPALRTPNRP